MQLSVDEMKREGSSHFRPEAVAGPAPVSDTGEQSDAKKRISAGDPKGQPKPKKTKKTQKENEEENQDEERGEGGEPEESLPW